MRRLVLLAAACALTLAAVPPAQAAAPPMRSVMFVGNNWDGTADVVDSRTYQRLRRINVIPDRDARMAEILTNPDKLAFFLAVQQAIGEGHDQLTDDMFSTHDGRILAVSRPSFADVVGIEIATGRILWRFPAGGVESSPLLVNNVLYFGSWDHHVYALDVRNRKRPRLLWKFKADDEVNSSPAAGGGLVYFGTNNGSVYALNARTGRLQWRAQSFTRFGRREYFYATPTVAYGRVYIGNTDGTLFAFGARTGHLLWARHAGTYVYTAAAVWRRKVYVGTWDGKVSAFDAATGSTIWSFEAPAAVHGAPTILNGILYFSTCPRCGAGGSRHTKKGPRGTFGLDARNGRVLWRFWDGQYSPVVADRERLYIAGHTRVYGFEPLRKDAKKKPNGRKLQKQP